MGTILTRLRAVTAIAALATATTLLPMQTAQAEPAAPVPAAPVTLVVPAAPATLASDHVALGTGMLFGSDTIKQQGGLGCFAFGLFCVGAASDAPPGQTVFSIPLLGWFLGSVAICAFGITVKKGPYGSLQVTRSSDC